MNIPSPRRTRTLRTTVVAALIGIAVVAVGVQLELEQFHDDHRSEAGPPPRPAPR